MPRSRNVSKTPQNASTPNSPPPDTTCCSTIVTSDRASSSRTPSSSAFRIASWWASAGSKRASSNTGTDGPRPRRNSPWMERSTGCAGGSRADLRRRGMNKLPPRPFRAICLALWLAMPFAALGAPAADAQREPELKGAVQHAIDQAECFEDKFDSAVWYKMMEPRLRKRVPDREERMAILKNVFCEANRAGEMRIPPGLVMA